MLPQLVPFPAGQDLLARRAQPLDVTWLCALTSNLEYARRYKAGINVKEKDGVSIFDVFRSRLAKEKRITARMIKTLRFVRLRGPQPEEY